MIELLHLLAEKCTEEICGVATRRAALSVRAVGSLCAEARHRTVCVVQEKMICCGVCFRGMYPLSFAIYCNNMQPPETATPTK